MREEEETRLSVKFHADVFASSKEFVDSSFKNFSLKIGWSAWRNGTRPRYRSANDSFALYALSEVFNGRFYFR
jgi:hypothetical protein